MSMQLIGVYLVKECMAILERDRKGKERERKGEKEKEKERGIIKILEINLKNNYSSFAKLTMMQICYCIQS